MSAVYPGSFDPITNGHCDIIRRIQPIVGHVTVLISNSIRKSYLFTPEERTELAENALKGIPNVTVEVFDGLTVDYARANKKKIIVRGLRAVTDFEYELVMANMNKKLAPEIETMIFFASPEYYYISSNTVKEVAMHGGDVGGLVPKNVEKELSRRFKKSTTVARSKTKGIK